MALFAWDDSLSVGHGFIDNDHKKLVTMVNSFHEAMEQGRGNEVIGKVLNNLAIYTKEHFAREEAEMQRIEYPKYKLHKLEHEKLLKQVTGLQADFAGGRVMMTMDISRFLRDWLVTHIQQTDKQLGLALK
ncbi:bacteriohemerythrin [mine drainage metagenome]|uniref:Bacteriohemerythrin n=1 Tax=mine drainage metagenome TaxID=410659 RepID=A0A1J5PQS6_9ZZZZ